MTITVVDGEVGHEFCIPNVEVNIVVKTDLVKKGNFSLIHQIAVEINNPSIKFSTNEVLIGNRFV